MKKSSSKLLTFVLVLSVAIIPSVLSSCKSVESINSNLSTLDLRHSTHTDTVVIRDSNYIRDSIIINERTIHDTVYITKEIFREAKLSTLDFRLSTKTDTVYKTDSIVQVIEHPPERYVPPFYKRCTWALWIIVALAIGYGLLRRHIPRL